MSNRSARRLVSWIGTMLIVMICVIVISAYYLTGRHLQRIDLSEYAVITTDGEGGYTAVLDVDRLITKERLHNPTEMEKELYPEITAIKELRIRITPQSTGYQLETVTDSEDPTELLKEHGIRLIRTKWVLTKAEMEAVAGQAPIQQLKLAFSDYVRTSRTETGEYTAHVDLRQMLIDAGIGVDVDPAADVGARALRSLDVICQASEDGGYQLQATSSLPTVMDDLKTAGIRISGTQWVWTEAEMAAHIGTVRPLEPYGTPEPETPEPETPEPETPEPETPEPTTPVPTTPAPATPTATPTAKPTATPTTKPSASPTQNSKAIITLYGFDQTEVRKAIREAKEKKYGTKFKSSEIIFNYFAVGTKSTSYSNVFRVVYKITTTSGTEYLVADVYNLEKETGYKAANVYLTVAKDRSTAKSTSDLKGYTVHTLDGGSMVFSENKNKSAFDKNGLVMSKSLTEKITYDELWDIPATQDMTLLRLLGYARNEMFARGGHKFKDTSTYYKFYKKYSWYKPTGTVSVDALAKKYPETRKNITTIQFLEKLIKEG